VLTYEESKGLALQGTYVYKNAVAGSRYGYADFYNKVVEEYNQATNTETVNSVTVKVHSNGHKFYDITKKNAIDNFYDTMGSAWFYGVDTVNERIFLPRDNYFAVKGVAPVVGNGNALGLTDGTSDFGMIHWTTSTVGATLSSRGYTVQNAGATTSDGVGSSEVNGKFIGVTTDATKSGIETSAEGLYLYFYVGETLQGLNDINLNDLGDILRTIQNLQQKVVELETLINAGGA
jgi:hypothetical protein